MTGQESPDSVVVRGAVVVGFDGSQRAWQAAHWAAREATGRGLRLVVVNAIRGPFPEVMVTPVSMPLPQFVGEEAVRAYTNDHLAELAAEFRRESPDLEVDTHVFDGHPAAVLAEVAREAALLVIGSSGATGLGRVFTGSITADLANHSPGPVVVVRESRNDGSVVVGVDGSEPSDRAVEFAVDFASHHGGDLVAVHGTTGLPMDALTPGGVWAQGWTQGLGFDAEQLKASADLLIAKSLAGPLARHPGVRAQRVVSLLRPAQALLEQADGAALLVVGSHGHGPVRRALLGSVSHAMLHHAPCSLAIVRG